MRIEELPPLTDAVPLKATGKARGLACEKNKCQAMRAKHAK